jgi:hypothetical protein
MPRNFGTRHIPEESCMSSSRGMAESAYLKRRSFFATNGVSQSVLHDLWSDCLGAEAQLLFLSSLP